MQNVKKNNNLGNNKRQKRARNQMSANEILQELAPQKSGEVCLEAWSDFLAFVPQQHRPDSKNRATMTSCIAVRRLDFPSHLMCPWPFIVLRTCASTLRQ